MMTTAADKSEVMIHLETRNVQDGQVNQLVQDVPGQFFNMGKTIYLRYQEKATDGQTAAVTFKVNAAGDEVQLSRHQGDNRSRMIFAVNQQVEAKYQTAYGNLPLTILTPKLNVSLSNYPISGKVSVDYTLFSNGQELGQYKIRLQFTA
ncbi:hypothetical protein LPAF129_17890 [Ligilactobacillus pabuli]|uniref:DUF1934 domain-containing protein n=1 Tax=Ligilactobacillus pabuli TaxID=2886039 RepID=A0ABQ5JJQ2_9LACO|nr:DUF1934 domain-containing protein [Ligilactobacillus pabuli]GKS82103.1 hypothetical protein LPAF129_17890 [Ligilactobacillus pabuli]